MDDQIARICVDADGGDDAPAVVADGVALALEADPNLKIVLVGRAASIEAVAAAFPDRVEPVVTTEVIEMGDHPAQAVRRKKDSSIVVGCKLVKEGRADGFFSAGSTGACLTAATILVGRIPGVARPALATVLPAPGRPAILVDCGANADCKAEYLLQFAQMGVAYAQSFLGVEAPEVGLLCNGSEETKGNELALAAHALLAEHVPGFIGNIEGGDVLAGSCDVIVTDGFTGNVALKVIEGTAGMIFSSIKAMMAKADPQAVAAIAPGLGAFKKTVDPDTYGGAPLLGIDAVCTVGHGSSNAEAIKNGILACAKTVRGKLPERIAAMLEG